DALDAPARIIVRLVAGKQQPADVVPLEPAVVADINRTVGSKRRTIRTAAKRRDDFRLALPPHSRERSPRDLDQDHAAVRHRDRTFGKLQTGSNFTDTHARSSNPGLVCGPKLHTMSEQMATAAGATTPKATDLIIWSASRRRRQPGSATLPRRP